MPKNKTTTNFNLTELLLVAAAIAVLLSLLMPSLNRALETGRKQVCANNLRQHGLVVIQYTEDFNDLVWSNHASNDYPAGNGPSCGSFWMAWYGRAYEPAYTPNIWICPSSTDRRRPEAYPQIDKLFKYINVSSGYNYSAPRIHSPSYGITWFEVGRNGGEYIIDGQSHYRPKFWRLSQFNQPSQTIYITDSYDDGANIQFVSPSLGWHSGDYRPSNRHIGEKQSIVDTWSKVWSYEGSANYVFFDNHVEDYGPIDVSTTLMYMKPDTPNLWTVIKP